MSQDLHLSEEEMLLDLNLNDTPPRSSISVQSLAAQLRNQEKIIEQLAENQKKMMDIMQSQQPQQQQQQQLQQQQQQESQQQKSEEAAGSDQPPLRGRKMYSRRGHGRGRSRAGWYERNWGRGGRGGRGKGGRRGRGGRGDFHVNYYF
ncbi:hypothetical protein PUN28_009731 [Cardiocondyla obscurior]|uniref:Uncharacterized protein n=2 Tax=Cardiocondyla obscurior TaxID=286306 RepID=A0AAW2FMN0_9HYME